MTDKPEISSIVLATHAAFETARRRPLLERAAWLRAIAAGLESNSVELVAIAHEETNLLESRLHGELVRTVFQGRLLAREVENGEFVDATIDHADATWGMGPRPDLRRMNVPLGVVAVYGASNFPFAFSVAGGDSLSAIAAGCAVVHKGHSDHPRLAARTAQLVQSALAAAGAPDGLFALVTGRAAGVELIQHPLVKAGAFTGSSQGGRTLFDLASARPQPIPFFGELGSTNPVFVTAAAWRARRSEILGGYANSVALGMGQFCTKPGFLLVPGFDDSDRLVLEKTSQGLIRTDLLSPRLRGSFIASRDALIARSGASVVMEVADDDLPGITFVTVPIESALSGVDLLETEMFGPASVILTGAHPTDLVAAAGRLEGQLTATIFSEPGDDIEELVNTLELKAGRILFDEWPTGVSVTYAQQHGGPYPASTNGSTTSVGTAAIRRFLRPVAYQNAPQPALPAELRDDNLRRLPRRINGEWAER